ncbi:MAG: hypothetical protein JSV52_13065 [Candidatus Zixiibacteriota bacterium]|nr:MAG: hypothetical protein JSV52_13065 [candidate division Zixibacteria bacterium]
MPVEDKQTDQQAKQPTPPAKPARSGNILKYALFGVGAMALVVIVAVAAMYFMKNEPSVEVENSHAQIAQKISKTAAERHDAGRSDAPTADQSSTGLSEGGSELEDLDESAIDKIMENLAFLDYEPTEDEIAEQEGRMTKEDSLEQVNWLEQEKAGLAQREKELNARQTDLERLEKEVNKKILTLEQAESARTAQLAKLYDGMDPRAVATLLANLDDQTVVAILPRMKLKNASAVLQLMPAQRAARLSKQMITIAEK